MHLRSDPESIVRDIGVRKPSHDLRQAAGTLCASAETAVALWPESDATLSASVYRLITSRDEAR